MIIVGKDDHSLFIFPFEKGKLLNLNIISKLMESHTLWGMIHVPALPGSGNNPQSIDKIINFCLEDAQIFFENGIDHLFIENFGDAPFPKSTVEPQVIVALTSIINHIKAHFPRVLVGVNVLRNDAIAALAIASITQSHAIRVNVLTHARLTDQGIIEGCSYELAKFRRQLQSEVEVWADVEVKHSFPLADIPLSDTIHDMLERGGANKIIFSGSRTGSEADLSVLKNIVEGNILTPEKIVIGSGISEHNISSFMSYARNFIVGSSLKVDNKLSNHIDPNKVSSLVSKVR